MRRRAPTAILFGAVDEVSAVVGRDAAVGLTGVEASVEIKQQRVEVFPAVASSAATLGGGGAAAGSSGSYVASRIVYVGGAENFCGECWSG